MIGDNIKKIMDEKNILAKDLAVRSGISTTYLSYVINGKRNPSLNTLKAIAEVLDSSLGELVAGDKNLSEAIEDFYYSDDNQKKEIEEREKELLADNNGEDIFTKAAHRVGHKGPLSEEEKEKIALAIKIALTKNGQYR